MQIKEKDFDKLKQLDRIEFLLRREEIKSRHDFNFSSTYWTLCCIGLILAVGVFAIFGKVFGLDKSYLLNILIVGKTVAKLIITFMLLEALFVVIMAYQEVKAMKALRERYFKFKVHVKKKNGH